VSRGTFRFEPCAPELPLSVLTGHMSCDVLILVSGARTRLRPV